jgi:GMP synthase (glutamine-hydrolysing)
MTIPSKLRIGVLEAGSTDQALARRHGTMADWFRRYLAHQDLAEVDIYRSFLGEKPDDVTACDAWLITGSKHSVYDDFPWIAELMAFVRAAARDHPVIGVCFGHQIVAEAFGGKVEKADAGWGIGVHTYEVTSTRSWMKPGAMSLSLLASHMDQVVSPPPQAEVLGGSNFCPVGMMQIGDTIMTIQTHPEMTQEFADDLYRSRRQIIGDDTVDPALASLAQATNENILRDWIFAFIEEARALKSASASANRDHLAVPADPVSG